MTPGWRAADAARFHYQRRKMTANAQGLIARIKERNADRKRATDGGIHPRKPIAPVNAKALQAAERAIGFKLPELLRAIYLKVGNGGFGPGYGIMGIKGGARLDGCTLEKCYANMIKLETENGTWRWPRQLLPLANYGCGMWSCVDCAYKKLPMILWDPNPLDDDLEGAAARRNWAYSFWDQEKSLGTWLEGWLASEPEPEPKQPSKSWINKRLRLTIR
ncbi:MAG TPA: SMI1/KNR4 family protein [Pirellulaceae bacterium]|nr:SMI1/KNR4 family protein [Pirellulaceae bacterium]